MWASLRLPMSWENMILSTRGTKDFNARRHYGLAQVKGRNENSWDEKVTYDNEYIDMFKNKVWLDIK